MVLIRLIRLFVSEMCSHGLFDAIRWVRRLFQKKFYNYKFYQLFLRVRVKLFPPPKNKRTVTGKTRISILMPVYNTSPSILIEAIESVRLQTYQNWELCICDDCSTNEETLSILERYKGSIPNIKIVRSKSSLHIAGATNLAMEFATGDFVTFLDHDNTIEPDVIERIVEATFQYIDVDIIYIDEDKIEVDGNSVMPYYKPGWSTELLVIRKRLLLELGGMREMYRDAQDYDLALRATKLARRIVHIPAIRSTNDKREKH